MWRQGMFVMPFMTRLGITDSWGGWVSLVKVFQTLVFGVLKVLSHIVLSGMFLSCYLALGLLGFRIIP
jgi:photosystem II CP47 chlorophyll apoprotein